MKSHLLGIDIGTSSVRAGIFSEDGSLCGIAARGYPIDTPSNDRAEQDPEIWWRATFEAVYESLSTARISGRDIAGISFSGQMHGGVMLDRDSEPVAPAIIWADSRSAGELGELYEVIGHEQIEKKLMNRLFTGTFAATLFWLRKHDPGTWKRIRHILTPKDYIRYRMCGLFNTEPSDASATLLFDVGLREWADDILGALGIPIEFMPFVVNSNQHISETEGIEELTGLPDGIPLIMGGADQPVAALGNGILDEGTMFIAIGTGGQIVTPIDEPKNTPDLSLNMFCHLPESLWYLMGATLSAGLSLRWFRDTFCPEEIFDGLSKEAAQTSPGADGLMFAPYLAGRRSPVHDPSATGTFAGIRLMHTRGHFVRAVMEGVVFELLELLKTMEKTGVKPSRIIASGGWTNSPVWMQIMADCLGLSLHVSSIREQACFGAALLAGIGTGIYDSYRSAASIVPDPQEIVAPEKNCEDLYRTLFEQYMNLYLHQD